MKKEETALPFCANTKMSGVQWMAPVTSVNILIPNSVQISGLCIVLSCGIVSQERGENCRFS